MQAILKTMKQTDNYNGTLSLKTKNKIVVGKIQKPLLPSKEK